MVRPNEEEEENDAGATAQKPQLLSLTLHKADTKMNKLVVECVVRCSNTLKCTCTVSNTQSGHCNANGYANVQQYAGDA